MILENVKPLEVENAARLENPIFIMWSSLPCFYGSAAVFILLYWYTELSQNVGIPFDIQYIWSLVLYLCRLNFSFTENIQLCIYTMQLR